MTLDDVEKRLAALEASNRAIEASLSSSVSLQKLALGATIGFIGWTLYQHFSRPSVDVRVAELNYL